MSDDLVRYRQEEVHLGGGDVEYRYVESKDGWIASYADAKAALDAQAAEITRLRAELATARREGMERAVSEVHVCAGFWVSGNNEESKIRYDEARKIAAAILAAAGEGKP
jgi:hypothetical protein